MARISNHVYYHEKSAQRQALRELGIRKFISKNEIYQEIGKLNKNDKTQYIVSAIILVIMLGLLIRNIVGYKTIASIYGCKATD